MKVNCFVFSVTVATLAAAVPFAAAQTVPSAPAPQQARPTEAVPPGDYSIGPDDVLSIVFWREKDMTTDAIVRPDGKITLPLINDVAAAGLTPDQLRAVITTQAAKFIEDPAVTVIVKKINSRRVFITGQVEKPGPYDLMTPTTVMQFIAIAGGLKEFANRKEIVIMRNEGGKPSTLSFDYEAIVKRSKLEQNILLRPGDTVVVP